MKKDALLLLVGALAALALAAAAIAYFVAYALEEK